MTKLLVSGTIGLFTMLLYFKISYGLAAMNRVNPYINIIIGAAVECAGYTSASILINKIGRKKSFICYMTLTIICTLIIPFIMEQYPIETAIVAQVGKFAISGSLGVSWIYIPELFATTIRAFASGFFISVGRIGAITAPIVETLIDDKYMYLTFYIYAGLAFITVGLTLLLPETKNVPFIDKTDFRKPGRNIEMINSGFENERIVRF
ncbi:unnamed protein product [Didymodactylos carnosus]|uniref:Major facilitator superfamily (MFS) profile domain-containing protein n=1 Tax=Didymodactylos carnosus TaxID=1234261 RepID=A0A8S2T3C8_9BILA|nr:unnamed protein product [Didymodactylos carnosus]CAF4258199.1 unnamed protein product [Didymodactylos carnosus]